MVWLQENREELKSWMIQEEEECFLSQAASLMDVMKRIFQLEPKSTIFKIEVEMLNLVSRVLIYS